MAAVRAGFNGAVYCSGIEGGGESGLVFKRLIAVVRPSWLRKGEQGDLESSFFAPPVSEPGLWNLQLLTDLRKRYVGDPILFGELHRGFLPNCLVKLLPVPCDRSICHMPSDNHAFSGILVALT